MQMYDAAVKPLFSLPEGYLGSLSKRNVQQSSSSTFRLAAQVILEARGDAIEPLFARLFHLQQVDLL